MTHLSKLNLDTCKLDPAIGDLKTGDIELLKSLSVEDFS